MKTRRGVFVTNNTGYIVAGPATKPGRRTKPGKRVDVNVPPGKPKSNSSLSFEQIAARLQSHVDSLDTRDKDGMPLKAHYLKSVYDDYFIFEVSDGGGGSLSLFKQPYSVDSKGNVSVKGEPEPVREEVTYEPVDNVAKEETVRAALSELTGRAIVDLTPSHFVYQELDQNGTVHHYKASWSFDGGRASMGNTQEVYQKGLHQWAPIADNRREVMSHDEFKDVPAPPRPRWNADGTPCFEHLKGNAEAPKNNDEGEGVPEPVRPRWNADGTPDFSHLR